MRWFVTTPKGLRGFTTVLCRAGRRRAELALLADRIFRGPNPERDGVSSWTLPDLCRWIEARFDKRIIPQSLSRILRREGFSRQKTRPTHPKTDEKAQRRFAKRGSATRWMRWRMPIPTSG